MNSSVGLTTEQAFQATIDTMGLTEQEEIMEIVTSWAAFSAQKTGEEITLNLLREGMTTEAIVRVTGLTVEQVIQLQDQLTEDN
ncbi:hypothetical protein [uncultured Nostoc sp.]|uniref:hypothetical protein n=1 Tax=uncultured Nostoc sp. TaxID=340711 RepID=UPI0035CA27A3